MKEVKTFIENILEKKEGFSLGEPWKFSGETLGVIVPILRSNSKNRDYITYPEVKNKVTFEDKGSISPLMISGKVDDPVFIRCGTVLVGIKGQDRAVLHSMIFTDIKNTNEIEVKCVHASRPTSVGGGFTYGGYAPYIVAQSLQTGNQGKVWGSVKKSYDEMLSRSVAGFQCLFSQQDTPKHDSLPEIKQAMKKLDTNFQDILKQVPVTENQIGAVIFGMNGIVGIESFDSPESWKSQYKEVIEQYSTELSQKSKFFTFDEKKVITEIETFLKQLSNATTTAIDSLVYQIDMKNFIGEVATLNNHIVHLFLLKKDEQPEPQAKSVGYRPEGEGTLFGNYHDTMTDMRWHVKRKEPVYKGSSIGIHDDVIGTSKSGAIFERNHLHKFSQQTMKKGFDPILKSMEKHNGQATWTELENDTKLSTSTISARLREGKEVGLFGEGIRYADGKKVYTLRKNEEVLK